VFDGALGVGANARGFVPGARNTGAKARGFGGGGRARLALLDLHVFVAHLRGLHPRVRALSPPLSPPARAVIRS